MNNVIAFKNNKVELPKTKAQERRENVKRAKVLDAMRAMESAMGWDHYKIAATLKKRGLYSLAYHDICLEMTFPLPEPRKRNLDEVAVRFRLNEKATQFDAYLVYKICYREVPLHKPITVPIVPTVRAQAAEMEKAFTALYHGVYKVVGIKNLPGWPGEEALDKIRDEIALRACGVLNQLHGVIARELGEEDKPKRKRQPKNVIPLKAKD